MLTFGVSIYSSKYEYLALASWSPELVHFMSHEQSNMVGSDEFMMLTLS